MAHGLANALELVEGTFQFERARSYAEHDRRAKIPGKHAVLCRCGFYGIRFLEGDHRREALVLDSCRRERESASQVRVCSRPGGVFLLRAGKHPREATPPPGASPVGSGGRQKTIPAR